ncbi:MAG: bifunctional UDP-N-acetylglucosamine diphosphorylase/glucosamine-1-phosphate N-acetyltransferase GlmU [Sedimenticolaceae bacterium]
MTLAVVILAAGKGTRMKSSMPKVLHPLAHKPLVQHVIDTARSLDPSQIVVVYGHGGDQVREVVIDADLSWAEQAEQLGTGHAVQQAMPHIKEADRVLVLYGDVPLTSAETLRELLDQAGKGMGLLTINLDDPSGYGRIVRDDKGDVERIVEQKDANADELAIQEVNTGIMVFPGEKLSGWLNGLSNNNAQGEYYLTDLLAMAVSDGVSIAVTQPEHQFEADGVNNKLQLAELERAYQRLQADRLMTDGVLLRDPNRFDLRGSLTHGTDCEIDINVIIEGNVTLGNNVKIGANVVLRNVSIGDNTVVVDNCIFDDATVGADCTIGPFSRLRPGADLIGGAHIGNFVEIKKSVVGLGSKVNHLTYIGDSQIGAGVNIGAGTITCNYDGANKHTTVIGDNAFIGSNSALVAPVTIGKGATIGAGSVIRKDTPDDKLTLSGGKQVTIENWKRPKKQPK